MWAKCMLEESAPLPSLCPKDFADNAKFFLYLFYGLRLEDITHENCKDVYLNLVNIIERIV